MLKGTFVNIKHKFFRVFGLAKMTLLLAFTVARYNLEAIRSSPTKGGERTAARPEEDLPASAERLLDRLLKAGESVRHAGPMLVAKLGRSEPDVTSYDGRPSVSGGPMRDPQGWIFTFDMNGDGSKQEGWSTSSG